MKATQAEPELWQSLKDAAADPEVANLNQLWQELEKTVEELPYELRLQKLGQGIEQMAEILSRRSDLLLTAWEETYNSCGPVVREEAIAGFVRQSMALDLSELVDTSVTTGCSLRQPESDTSAAGGVDKSTLLKVVEDSPVADSQAQAVRESLEKAHTENIPQWVEAINQWIELNGKGKMISLVQLQQSIDMPLVEVWLGLLHSSEASYKFVQQSEFYDPKGIWLSVQG